MKTSKENISALVVSHFLINPIQNEASSTNISKFLFSKIRKVVQIEQPFPDSVDKFSYKFVYEDNKVVGDKFVAVRKPSILAYLIHPFIGFWLVVKTWSKYDVCIACDNLSFISMLPLRRLGLIKKIVYYSVDYVEDRFENRFLNGAYHFIDRLACEVSDENWVAVRDQVKARAKNGINIKNCSRFKLVPIGFRSSGITLKNLGKINFFGLVFCGALKESAGPQVAISAMPQIVRRFPSVTLTIIGGGGYRKYLEKLARELHLEGKIKFLGMIQSHSEVVKILTENSVGLAPYTYVKGSISYHSDPGKIKLYLLSGLPVITTQIATSNKILTSTKSGLVVRPDPESLAKAVIGLLENKKKYANFRSAAINLSKRYDSDRIFGNAFRKI